MNDEITTALARIESAKERLRRAARNYASYLDKSKWEPELFDAAFGLAEADQARYRAKLQGEK